MSRGLINEKGNRVTFKVIAALSIRAAGTAAASGVSEEPAVARGWPAVSLLLHISAQPLPECRHRVPRPLRRGCPAAELSVTRWRTSPLLGTQTERDRGD